MPPLHAAPGRSHRVRAIRGALSARIWPTLSGWALGEGQRDHATVGRATIGVQPFPGPDAASDRASASA